MDFKFKICLLGEINVGKTSLVYRFIENKFREDFRGTIGVNILQKNIIEENKEITAHIWDLGGHESFKTLRKIYLEGSSGALLIYDVTERETFEKLTDWIEGFIEVRGEHPFVLIGNKSDLTEQIKVKESEAIQFAKNIQ